jgi:hypothetical protein
MKRGLMYVVLVIFLTLTLPMAAMALPPTLPIDADSLDGYHATYFNIQIGNEASARAAADAGLDSRLTSVEAYESRIAALEGQLSAALDFIADLQTAVAALDPNGELVKLADHVTVETGSINGLAGPHVVFHDANVHIRSGGNSSWSQNGLGNLIVGYNEVLNADTNNRTGTHNIVVGLGHEFTSIVGIVAGQSNHLMGPYSSITGGRENRILAGYASITGGEENEIGDYGLAASISGGKNNTANSNHASVSGGWYNIARAAYASVSGGAYNTAEWLAASVSGGRDNIASSEAASVSGGKGNEALAEWSSVSGGYANSATGPYTSVSGGAYNKAAGGGFASVSGGGSNTASGQYASISGGTSNMATGYRSSISGGFGNEASYWYATVSGGSSNVASEWYATVSGGYANSAMHPYSTVSGGQAQTTIGEYNHKP